MTKLTNQLRKGILINFSPDISRPRNFEMFQVGFSQMVVLFKIFCLNFERSPDVLSRNCHVDLRSWSGIVSWKIIREYGHKPCQVWRYHPLHPTPETKSALTQQKPYRVIGEHPSAMQSGKQIRVFAYSKWGQRWEFIKLKKYGTTLILKTCFSSLTLACFRAFFFSF